MGMSFTRRDPRGGIGVDAAALEAGLAALVGAVEAGAGEGLTVAELLERVPMDAGARELIALQDPGLLRPSGVAAGGERGARRR